MNPAFARMITAVLGAAAAVVIVVFVFAFVDLVDTPSAQASSKVESSVVCYSGGEPIYQAEGVEVRVYDSTSGMIYVKGERVYVVGDCVVRRSR